MYKIWFEGSVPNDFASIANGFAEGIAPGDRLEQEPFFMLDMADGVVAGGRIYNAEVMKLAPRLLVIVRAGIGYEKVDVAAATAHGIAVCNTPDAPTISTAVVVSDSCLRSSRRSARPRARSAIARCSWT